MAAHEPAKPEKSRSIHGMLSLLFSVLSALSVVMIGVTSFTAFNPPDWLRIATMAPFPLLLIASVVFGIYGLRKSSGRIWAISALVLTALAVVAFIIMISAGG